MVHKTLEGNPQTEREKKTGAFLGEWMEEIRGLWAPRSDHYLTPNGSWKKFQDLLQQCKALTQFQPKCTKVPNLNRIKDTRLHTVFVIDAENKPADAGAFDSMDIAKLLEPAKAMELTSQPNPAKPGERILKDGFLFCVFGDDKFVDNSFKDMRQRKMLVGIKQDHYEARLDKKKLLVAFSIRYRRGALAMALDRRLFKVGMTMWSR